MGTCPMYTTNPSGASPLASARQRRQEDSRTFIILSEAPNSAIRYGLGIADVAAGRIESYRNTIACVHSTNRHASFLHQWSECIYSSC